MSETTSAALSSEPTSKPAPAAPRDYRFPHFERATLANGVQLVVANAPKLPLVTVLALVEGGATVEPMGKRGVAALSARLLLEGAAGMDGIALADRFERIGSSVEAHADWDVASVSLTTLSNRLPDALALVRDLLRSPTFPEREVQRLKEQRLADLLQQLAEPRSLADEQFAHALYESSARYAVPEEGDAASVRALTRNDVQQFHSARYQPAGTTLVFAGDVTMKDAKVLAESLFGDWKGARPADAPSGIDAVREGKLVRVVSKTDAPQSELRVGHRGLPRNTPDYFDAVVMNAVLGGLFSSRINLNLREVHGYTYGASSVFDWRRGVGPFVVNTAVKSDVTGAAVQEILTEIERIRTTPISEDELTLATSYLDGVFPIRYETTAAIASALANMVIHGLPEDYYDEYRGHVRAVTTDGVLRAAQRYLHPDELRIVVVGDPAVVASAVEAVTGVTPEIITGEGGEVAA
ncbi:MAG: peptidase domain protein [Gemmatimonadetes bacterium]|nr:peptidase domain protein [Gemmatimonadota bacterium]